PPPHPPRPTPLPYTTLFRSRTEPDHEPPLAVHGRLAPKRLREHEEDRRRGHVAVATQHRARVRHLGLAQLEARPCAIDHLTARRDRKSTRLNSSHVSISYAV